MTGPMLLEGKQLEEKRFDTDFFGELHDASRYESMTTRRADGLRRTSVLQGSPGSKRRRRGLRVLRRRDRSQGGRIATRETPMGTVTGTTHRRGLQEVRQSPAADDGEEHDDGVRAGHHDHLDRVRQRLAIDVRTACADQGPHQVIARLLASVLLLGDNRRRCRVGRSFAQDAEPRRRRSTRRGRSSATRTSIGPSTASTGTPSAPSCGRRPRRRRPSASCARCSATCSDVSASRISPSSRRAPTAPRTRRLT